MSQLVRTWGLKLSLKKYRYSFLSIKSNAFTLWKRWRSSLTECEPVNKKISSSASVSFGAKSFVLIDSVLQNAQLSFLSTAAPTPTVHPLPAAQMPSACWAPNRTTHQPVAAGWSSDCCFPPALLTNTRNQKNYCKTKSLFSQHLLKSV